MIKFNTIYNLSGRDSFISPNGSPLVTKKVIAIDKDNGCEYLKDIGQYNLYERIQSHRESCDLNMILSQLDPLQVNGMLSSYSIDDVLNSGCIDVSTLPSNPGEMLNLVKEGQQIFDGLPLEVRKEFNFSPNLFISSFGSDDFLTKLSRGFGFDGNINSTSDTSDISDNNLGKGDLANE